MNTKPTPEPAEFAKKLQGNRLNAPSAERNIEAISQLVSEFAPPKGRALELASGTGQHVVHHARRHPGIIWQPSDIDPGRLASVRAWMADANLPNILPPITLNATKPDWSDDYGGQDLILLSNLLHLIPENAAKTLISETADALRPGGKFILYGPFMRGGELTSKGDIAFHNRLQTQNPEIGYKDDFDVLDWGQAAWLTPSIIVEMPANNIGFVFKKG